MEIYDYGCDLYDKKRNIKQLGTGEFHNGLRTAGRFIVRGSISGTGTR